MWCVEDPAVVVLQGHGRWKMPHFGDLEDVVTRRCYALVVVRTWGLEGAMLW